MHCTIEGCESPRRSRGLCNKHYHRLRKDKAEQARIAETKSLVQEAVDRERAKHTRIFPREELGDDKFFYPQGKPQHERIVLAARSNLNWPPRLIEPREFARTHWPLETFHLRAKQNALALPDGTVVVWFGWELA